MTQLGIDWSRDVSLPVQGRTLQARHASSTGAQVAARRRSEFSLRYREQLIVAGPLSDQQAAKVMGCGLSSINSTRDAWGDSVVPSGEFETVVWPKGGITKRVRWKWAD